MQSDLVYKFFFIVNRSQRMMISLRQQFDVACVHQSFERIYDFRLIFFKLLQRHAGDAEAGFKFRIIFYIFEQNAVCRQITFASHFFYNGFIIQTSAAFIVEIRTVLTDIKNPVLSHPQRLVNLEIKAYRRHCPENYTLK